MNVLEKVYTFFTGVKCLEISYRRNQKEIKYSVYYQKLSEFPETLKLTRNPAEGEEFWILNPSEYSTAYSIVVGVLKNRVTLIYPDSSRNKRLIELFDDQLYQHIIYGTGVSLSGPCIVYGGGSRTKFDNVQQIMDQIFQN